MRRISKDITKHYQMACSSGELHVICFLWAHVFYVLILPFLQLFSRLHKSYTSCHSHQIKVFVITEHV